MNNLIAKYERKVNTAKLSPIKVKGLVLKNSFTEVYLANLEKFRLISNTTKIGSIPSNRSLDEIDPELLRTYEKFSVLPTDL